MEKKGRETKEGEAKRNSETKRRRFRLGMWDARKRKKDGRKCGVSHGISHEIYIFACVPIRVSIYPIILVEKLNSLKVNSQRNNSQTNLDFKRRRIATILRII